MIQINRPNLLSAISRFRLSERHTAVLFVYLVIVIIAALLAPWISPYDPNEQDLVNALQGPSTLHWLGTDDLGRDVLSRIIHGARISLRASLQSVAVALAIAVPLGVAAGFIGGLVDNLIMRLLDVLLALPALVFVIAISTALGGGLNQTMLALSLAFVPTLARIARAETLTVRRETFIEASQSIGTPMARILWSRVLRNITPALQVQTTITMSIAIGAEASLSFIGLGAQPPQASWGSVLRRSFDFIFANPLGVLWPAIIITLTAWAFNALGDAQADRAKTSRATAKKGFRVITPVDRVGHVGTTESDGHNSVQPVLRVENLAVGVDTAQGRIGLVEGVTFEAHRGRVVGVVGESGSGKTVTALSLTRLFDAGVVTSGRVMLNGEDLMSMNSDALRQRRGRDVSMVFQTPSMSLNPAMRIVDQIIEVLQLHNKLSKREARKRAELLLGQVGISKSRADDYPHQLSGGMCQRVMIAIGIACSPPLLIADEPTSALDVTVQAEILDLLRKLKHDGMSLIMVTHDFGVVADICDDVVVMYAGQIVERGPVSKVLSAPAHPYTRALLAAMPTTGHKGQPLASIRGQVPLPGTYGQGCRFAARCAFATSACTDGPIPLEAMEEGRAARCIRIGELPPYEETKPLTESSGMKETMAVIETRQGS